MQRFTTEGTVSSVAIRPDGGGMAVASGSLRVRVSADGSHDR